jgi:hypothetical protein
MNPPSNAPLTPPLSKSELLLLRTFAVFGLSSMGIAIVLMGLYMYFLPGANPVTSIIP